MKNSIIKFIVLLSLLIFSGFSHAQTGWITQSSGTSQDFRGVYFINSQTGWAYGFLNNIRKTTNGGINWISQNSGTNESFMTAYFKDENTGWMAGGHHYNRITIVSKTTNGGQSWNTQHYSSNGGCAMGSSFINSYTGWVACAANGRVLKTTNGGLNWIVLYTSVNVELHNCFFVNQYTGWVIGLNGSISKTTNGGNTWSTQTCSTSEDFTGIFFQNSNTGYVSGTNGVFFKTTNSGSTWNSIPSGSTQWLNSIYFIDEYTGWMVGGAYYGGDSQILKSVNSGESWIFQTSPTTYWLADVKFANSNTGWAVGRHGVIINTVTGGGNLIPLPPTLISPPNNSINISTTPTLTWNTSQGATSYCVQVSSIANFQVIRDSATITTTQYQIPAGKLLHGYTYFWRVNASSSAGTSSWSSIWNFATNNVPPLTPVLISPLNGSLVTTTPLLDWNDVSSATSYRLQVSEVANFMTTVIDKISLTPSQYQVVSGELSANVKYYWRARTRNTVGWSPWASAWNFTTQPTGVNLIAGEIPKEFDLHQNYPNPFNPETKIKFDIPKSSNVTIIVYDNLGRIISELVNKRLNAGSFKVNWNATGHPSGVYFYKIKTEEFTDVKRMILLK